MARGAVSRRRRSDRRAAGQRGGQGLNEATASTLRKPGLGKALPTETAAAPALVASGRRGLVLSALTAAGVEADAGSGPITPTYELTQGSPAELRFLAEAAAAGFRQASHASWPCEAELGNHGEVLHRNDCGGLFRLENGTLVLATIRDGWARFQVAGPSRAALAEVLATFSSAYPPLYRDQANDDSLVPITFWSYGQYGPRSRLRMIEASRWDGIQGNYNAAVRAELGRLMGDTFKPGQDGQLLLWQGEPGTGKTWALRALASEWEPWAEFHYITDPDAFFVSQPDYLIDVLLADTYDVLDLGAPGEADRVVSENAVDGKWRVLILEDTGELLSAKAKEAYGQGLSRLLNVVDGMVGQGLKVLAIVTTNDELGDLHPAAVRPGRCASQVVFGPLSAEEAATWLGDDVQDGPLTLAELYAMGEESGAEAFAPADSDECSCGHLAADHNEDGCMADGCDCEQFDLADAPTDAPVDDDGQTEETDETAGLADPFMENLKAEMATPLTADGTPAVDLPDELQPGTVMPEQRPSPPAPVTNQPVRSTQLKWEAIFAPEGRPTDDGRIMAPGSISWRTLPLSLMAQLMTEEGHDGATVCGRIDDIYRAESLIRAGGIFDESEFALEVARMVDDRVLRGLSIDLAIREFRVLPRSAVLDEDGNWKGLPPEEEDDGEADLLDLLFGPPEDEPVVFVVTDAVIGCATIVSFPAFAEAQISLAASAAGRAGLVWNVTMPLNFTITEDTAPREPLTASAAGLVPVEPPAEWFTNPAFTELTPLTVTDDGRVIGHAAGWSTCHIAFPDSCVLAPHSRTDYQLFHLGEVRCEDGSRVATGKITIGTDHANLRLGVRGATEHYDNTGTAVADIVVGEDEHGIWVAGALRPELSAVKVRELRGSALSGDWRDLNGNLELVALLACNIPGFPIPRTHALIAAAVEGDLERHEAIALVAAGIVCGCTPVEPELSEDEIREELAAMQWLASGEPAKLAAQAKGET